MSDDVIYVLLCRDCEAAGDLRGETPIPFGSAEERGKWAARHRDATGHYRWWVKDLPGKLTVPEDEDSAQDGLVDMGPYGLQTPVVATPEVVERAKARAHVWTVAELNARLDESGATVRIGVELPPVEP